MLEWLHYRVLDVSSIKEGVRRWASQGVREGVRRKRMLHEARADDQESLEEGRYYMRLFKAMGNEVVAEGGGGENKGR